jgi:diguanylate cyclase (GGDEF)-like protein
MSQHKLHNTLAIMTLFGVITALGITPFAFYRFANGQPVVGAIDLLIVACICIGVFHARRTGRTEGASLFIVVVETAGCVVIAHVGGLSGLLWVFPMLLANFLLIGRAPAVAVSAFAIAAVALADSALPNVFQKLIFAVSASVACLFAYVFASRAEAQRLQLEAIAAHDPLTGAYNRRGMETELQIAMSTSARRGSPLGLLVFDLDHFKQINDQFGHETGDAVLVRVAGCVRGCTRLADRYFRLGGEEFGLLIPGADPEALQMVAEKLRAAVEEEVHCGGRSVTVSIGGTCLALGESGAELLARADAAMYQAKREGRNRTVIDAGSMIGSERTDLAACAAP